MSNTKAPWYNGPALIAALRNPISFLQQGIIRQRQGSTATMRTAGRANVLRLAAALGLACAVTALPALPASAQNTLRAAAVVNDEVISALDLAMRTRLAILAAGLEDSPEVRRRLRQQILRTLIDERLQMQEAERLDIKVAEGELDKAVEQLARQNKMSREQFFAVLKRNSILPATLTEQVRGNLTWRAIVQRRLRPQVAISEEEIEEVIGRLRSSSGQVQLRVSEILIAVDSVVREDDARRAADRLAQQLRGGADFAALARQFSQSATASVGGDLGWIEREQLANELGPALARMQPGEMAGPILSLEGFYFLRLADRRRRTIGDATVGLKQVLFALPPTASDQDVEEARRAAAEIRPRIAGCESVEDLAREVGSPGPTDLGTLKLSDLPQDLRQSLGPLQIGQPSEPVLISAGISVFLVCSREEDGIDRDRIRETLVGRRLNILSRRYLRDLRRSANVDIRL